MKPTHHIRSRLLGTNVPRGERIVSALVGGALTLFAARRRSFVGIVSATVGAAAISRAITGRSVIYRARALRKGIQARRAITIQCSPREVYDVWRDLPNLPRFMHHLESVTMEGDGISRWVIDEGGRHLVWRARIVEDTPGQRLRWESLPGGDIATNGSVELREAPGDRGTEVEVKVHYLPPGGLIVASALHAFLRRLARMQIGMELVRLRQLIETGEIATGARRIEEITEQDKGVLMVAAEPAARPTPHLRGVR
jgi:uncharacterized membrane protein